MNMKDDLIKRYNLKLKTSTKWNDVYESEHYILICNRATGELKIKINRAI